LTWRVEDVHLAASMLDFTADADGRIVGDGPEVLKQRLVGTTQVLTRHAIQALSLREALASPDVVGEEVSRALAESPAIGTLGVRVLALSIQAIRPTPETSRALEAEAREELLRRADEAVYERRNAAVLQERRIKESELQTELAVEERQRQIREAHMAADIAVEEQRSSLIAQKTSNDRQEADARAYALETILQPVRDVDWRTLMAVGAGSGDSRLMIAVAFRELAENAQKIGELNVTPDLLNALLKK
jgi:regulator of protease activity HflC (stomatin/prohibitin superfamily)